MSILEELYNGNISPIERFIKDGSEYSKLFNSVNENEDRLFEHLSREQKALYESIAESKGMLEGISEKEIFIDGFRLGARIMLEILTESDRQFLTA